MGKLKEKLYSGKNEVRAYVASVQRVSDRSDELLQSLTESRAKLLKVTKQKEANEKSLRNEITRLKLENDKLTDRLRNKASKYVY